MRATCHYCGERQLRWKLRPLELSAAGAVDVCRDADACRTRARVGALVPTRAYRTQPPLRRRRFMGRSGARWVVALAVLVVGVVVLPHFTIDGHHYHFWLIP